MTDKDKITFAIRYLKQGLKSKRTPPLYEELMNELGFVSEKELFKLAGLTSEYYELENLKNNEINKAKEIMKGLYFIILVGNREGVFFWTSGAIKWFEKVENETRNI